MDEYGYTVRIFIIYTLRYILLMRRNRRTRRVRIMQRKRVRYIREIIT